MIKILTDKIERIEKERNFEKKIKDFNQKLFEFCDSSWNKESKRLKKYVWNYFLFILITLIVIFVLVSFRDNILGRLNISVTDISKLYYSGIITAVGFLATAIRSFFDTKNIIKGFRIIFLKGKREIFRKENFVESTETYKKTNNEPSIDE